jgi:hypothetical protein
MAISSLGANRGVSPVVNSEKQDKPETNQENGPEQKYRIS